MKYWFNRELDIVEKRFSEIKYRLEENIYIDIWCDKRMENIEKNISCES